MSAVIFNDSKWNEEWHEELLTISLLEKGPLHRSELKEKIRNKQEGMDGPSHLDSAYNYWIRGLKERGIIKEVDRVLCLAWLGKWIAISKLGSLFERNSFLQNFVCKNCSSFSKVVLLTPLSDTIDPNKRNAKGEIWVDSKCPMCETMSTHHLGFSKCELIKFYNQAVVELGQFGELEAKGI